MKVYDNALLSSIFADVCFWGNCKKEYKCFVCGYNNHVEIAHIKAVSDFDKEAELSEINNINNLVALCPNHH